MEVRTRQATRMALSLEVKGGEKEKKMSPAANKQLLNLHGQKQYLRRTNMVYRCWARLIARPGKGTGTS